MTLYVLSSKNPESEGLLQASEQSSKDVCVVEQRLESSVQARDSQERLPYRLLKLADTIVRGDEAWDAITSLKRSGGGAHEHVSDQKFFCTGHPARTTLVRIWTGRWLELTLEANMGVFDRRAGK